MGSDNRIFLALTILIMLIFMSVQNAVALVEEKSLNDLTKSSDNIIIGKVISKESYWKDGNIFTNVTVSVNQYIKGKSDNQSDNQFIVKIHGGTVGNIYAEVSDVPSFEDNEDVLLFLKGNQILGWNQGKYTIKDGKIKETGESIIEFIRKIKQQNVTNNYSQNYNYSSQNYAISNTISNTISNAIAIMPHITNITPKYGRAKAAELGSSVAASDSTQMTIIGSGFGTIKGNVKFWYAGNVQYLATIVSWTDDEIVVKVPGRISSYTKPDGTGNVQVSTSDGAISDNYGDFDVNYSYGGGKWSGNKTIYMINPKTVDDIGAITAVQAAADTWNNANTSFEFVYGGTTPKTDVAMDGENSIIWVNYDTGSVATTTTYWRETDPKTIIESDTVFNNYNNNWGTDDSQTKMDIQTVATHEMGHWLQLLDLYGAVDDNKTMYGYVFNGEIKRTLNMNDIAGIRDIYGLVSLDKVAPTTTIIGVIEGATYNSNVTITLTAIDNVGGSGVRNIAYAINDEKMTIYSAPFIVNETGKNTVTYRSIDNIGNIEQTKSINFTISSENILAYYRGLNNYPDKVETIDLLKAADNWRDDVIPPGLSTPITTNQLLVLADEWRNS